MSNTSLDNVEKALLAAFDRRGDRVRLTPIQVNWIIITIIAAERLKESEKILANDDNGISILDK